MTQKEMPPKLAAALAVYIDAAVNARNAARLFASGTGTPHLVNETQAVEDRARRLFLAKLNRYYSTRF